MHTAVAPVPWHCRGTAVARPCHGRVTAVSQPCHVAPPPLLFHCTEQNRAPLAGPLPLYRLGPQSVNAVGELNETGRPKCFDSRGTSTVALPWHGRVTAASQPCHVAPPPLLFHFTEQNRAPLAGPLPLVQIRTTKRKRCWGIVIIAPAECEYL